MKRVLVITYYWPPSGGSGVQRWVKFAKYLPQEGWQPVIYTPENPEYTAIDHTLEAEIPHDTEILRRPITEPYNIYRKLMGKGASTDMKTLTAGASKGEVTEISSGKKTFKQRLSLWIRGNLFVPDPRVGWVRPSVRLLKKYLAEHPVDVIVTTGPPHSMHLIGQRLHRELGIPWIPDFRDPWTRMYYLKHLPMTRRTWRRLRAMEQSVLDECTTVLAVTPLVQEEFQAQTKTPVAMITNGYDGGDFDQPVEPDGLFNVVHTGLFAADGNPLNLWKVLGVKAWADAEFKKALRLRLVGRVDREVYAAIEEAGLRDNVVDLGYCDHLTAVREQLAASLLILPLRNDPARGGPCSASARRTGPWPASSPTPAPASPPAGTTSPRCAISSTRPGNSTRPAACRPSRATSPASPAATSPASSPPCWSGSPPKTSKIWTRNS